jgi:hypothetical protein
MTKKLKSEYELSMLQTLRRMSNTTGVVAKNKSPAPSNECVVVEAPSSVKKDNMKHEHIYKQTGEVEVETGKWLIAPDGMNPAVPETKRCLVFICECGDMLLKPIPILKVKER